MRLRTARLVVRLTEAVGRGDQHVLPDADPEDPRHRRIEIAVGFREPGAAR